ncbi:hypothetical protein BU17DRAFT_95631 [Hysterangium stoloniferum]|nr:hypothetical protein BU17DRAFT_95631 [Hysterangium stoloniferum]
MSLSTEQLKHDRINLVRLVKRLETSVTEARWTQVADEDREEAWVNAQGMAQKIRYARKLLLNVDTYADLGLRESQTPTQQRYLQNTRETLDRLDGIVDSIKQQLEPQIVPSTYFLSSLPLPSAIEPKAERAEEVEDPSQTSPEAMDIPSKSFPPSAVPDITADLLPAPSEPNLPSSSSQTGTSSLLSASLQTHDELTEELARMTAQLKRNAQHFAESLEKDKGVVLSASETLEKNYDTMARERIRLKDHSGKSRGTTWLVIAAVVGVAIAFVFTFLVIRIT